MKYFYSIWSFAIYLDSFLNTTRIKWPPLCCVFHYLFEHLGRHWDDFGTNVELVNGLRLAGVHFAFQITPEKEGIKSGYLGGQSMSPLCDIRRPENFRCRTELFDLQCGMAHRLVETSNRQDLCHAFVGWHNEPTCSTVSFSLQKVFWNVLVVDERHLKVFILPRTIVSNK